jgi:hypothetical protein
VGEGAQISSGQSEFKIKCFELSVEKSDWFDAPSKDFGRLKHPEWAFLGSE